MPALITNTTTVNAVKTKVYSAPVSRELKQFLVNESIRTGLDQKLILTKMHQHWTSSNQRLATAAPITLP